MAQLHLDKLGVKLTTQSQEQADDVGVKVEGPHKLDHHRYQERRPKAPVALSCGII